MIRLAVCGALALACAVGLWELRPAPDASAVAQGLVVGVYKLKLKGDGWLRSSSAPYLLERVGGNALLVLSRNVPDDGKLKVEIRLDRALTGGLVDLATPDPAFVGTGYVVGDSLAVIDTGGPTYVNAFTLTFLKEGARVAGHWISAYPAVDPAAGPASAVGIEFAGRKLQKLGRGVR